jgi:sulfate transport system permease protein
VIYGVVLTTARCLGEYGAVAVVHGYKLTATLQVQESYENFDQQGAYAVSVMLAVVAVLVLVTMILVRPREGKA